ncbi:MAG: M48 family metalloprotease [Desulfobacterales bacterium]|nr:M48 family metalloprotease [Desulfobacterales bacterium]
MAVVSSPLAMTVQEEEELSKEFLKVVQTHFEVIQDPLIVNYVNRIGNRVIAGFLPQPFQYHFNVIKQEVYNAFAGPGGYVYINSGLLAAMDEEEELAGILAHEISHVSCRHISEKIARSGKIQMATLAGMVAGIFLGATGGGDAASALTIGSMAAGQSVILAYSREDEREADKVGLRNLYAAGYTGDGLLTVMKKIRAKQWYTSDDVPSYITTHPGSEERIAYIGNWIASNPPPNFTVSPDDDFEFNRIKTRLIALYDDKRAVINQYEKEVRDKPNNFFAHYGYGLALMRTGHYQQSVDELKKAMEQRAFDPYLPTDMAQAYFLGGRYEAALKLLTDTVPGKLDTSRLFYLGRVQMETGRFEAAKNTFLQLRAMDPNYPAALYYLGETYGKMEIMDEAHFYLGMYYKEKADVMKAVFHLERALTKATSEDHKSKIEAELKLLSKRYKKEIEEKEREKIEKVERERQEQEREQRERDWYLERERRRRE